MEALNPDDVFYIIVHCSATKVTSDYTPEQMRADMLFSCIFYLFIRTIYYFCSMGKEGNCPPYKRRQR